MATTKEIIERLPRVMWLGLIMAAAMALLVMRLWWLQVAQASKYDESGAKQSLRSIRLPAARGKIYDRNGVCLVDNQPTFDLVLYLEDLRTRSGKRGSRKSKTATARLVEEEVQRVAKHIHYSIPIDTNAIRKHVDQLMPLPFTVAENLPEDAVARFSARNESIPSMDLQIGAIRSYPYGSLAAHVLGYVGRTAFPPDEELHNYYYYMPDMIGREGIEAQFDDQLRGRAGGRSLTVDVVGYRHGEVGLRAPQPGKNLHLTLDADIQLAVEEALGDRVGAAVVVNPLNGDILAMCSTPSYNANAFSPRIRPELFQQLISDPDKPFINRAIRAYAPGSTFKIITALAGLENGVIDTICESECTGSFLLGNRSFGCWIRNRGGAHGRVNLSLAIKHSCNVFFYEHGIKTGAQPILAMAKQFYFEERTGVPLGAFVYRDDRRSYQLVEVESRGHLPDFHARFSKGDIANISIGQGEVGATPLQMAYVAAAIANGGTVWAPRLVDRFESQELNVGARDRVESLPPQVRGRVQVSPHNLRLIREAMTRVVEDEDGTGRRAHVPGVRIAGKSGTAQYEQRDADTGEKHFGHHVWFISFAPVDEPRYAMAVMVEDGDSGGTTCAPITGAIYKRIFELERNERRDSKFAHRPSRPRDDTHAN